MKTEQTEIEKDRAEYRGLRATCARHNARAFDGIAASIAHELADGEDITPALYIRAARIVCSGQDFA
jgi:hypothetical protein